MIVKYVRALRAIDHEKKSESDPIANRNFRLFLYFWALMTSQSLSSSPFTGSRFEGRGETNKLLFCLLSNQNSISGKSIPLSRSGRGIGTYYIHGTFFHSTEQSQLLYLLSLLSPFRSVCGIKCSYLEQRSRSTRLTKGR